MPKKTTTVAKKGKTRLPSSKDRTLLLPGAPSSAFRSGPPVGFDPVGLALASNHLRKSWWVPGYELIAFRIPTAGELVLEVDMDGQWDERLVKREDVENTAWKRCLPAFIVKRKQWKKPDDATLAALLAGKRVVARFSHDTIGSRVAYLDWLVGMHFETTPYGAEIRGKRQIKTSTMSYKSNSAGTFKHCLVPVENDGVVE